MSGSRNSKYYIKKLRKQDSDACNKLDAFGFTKQTATDADLHSATDADLHSSSLPDSQVTPSTSESCVITDTPSITDQSNATEITGSKTQPEEIEKSLDVTTPESNSDTDSDSLSEPQAQNKKIKIDLRQDSSKYQYNYPWMYWSVPKDGYICKFCELFSTGVDIKWVDIGVSLGTHPSRKIQKHSDSDRHIKSTTRYAEVNAAFLAKSKKKPIYQQILDSVKDKDKSEKALNREILKKLFMIAHFMAQKYWAQRNFEDLVRFFASLGIEDLQYHVENAPEDATYLSSTTVTEFIDIIANHIENKLLTSLRNATMYTLLADESTDEQNREQLSIYARWTTVSAKPVDHFLGIVHVTKTNAESLLNAIQGFLVAKGLDITKCRFVGFDGANVMSGEVSGLQRRIRHLSPFCLYMNCRNHRLALCLKHLMKEYPLLVEADSVLLSMWKLFEYSPQRFAVFKSVQEAYGMEQITLIRAATTRWLSHGKACVRFIDRYEAVVDTLDSIYDERKEAEVFGLRTMVMQKNTVAMILLLCDVLRPINVLSLCLQDSSINFMDVESKVKAAANELENIITLLRANDDSTYFYRCAELFQEIDYRTDLQRRLRGDGFLPPDRFLETVGIPFIYSLIGEVTDAFQCHPVFKAFRALDPRCLPDDVRDLPDFGKIGWYNDHVAEKFTFPYEYDTLAVLIISTPDMFDKALIPFMVRTECPGTGDLIDHCVSEYFKQIKEKFSEIDVEAIHDFELLPSRRPKVLVQTAGHVAGAAYYYQRADVQPDPWDQSQKIFGVSIHPKYGGWFALRGVLIFRGVKCPDLEKKEPVDIVPTYELRKELLERFNFHWQDWTYRDIVPTVKKYSKDQMDYFSTPPKDRKGLVERLKQESQSQVTNKG